MKGWGLVYHSGIFDPYRPYLSIDNNLVRCQPYIYTNGEWKLCGATNRPMIPLLDEENNYVYDEDGEKIFVPRPKVPRGLITADNLYVKDATGAQVYVWE